MGGFGGARCGLCYLTNRRFDAGKLASRTICCDYGGLSKGAFENSAQV